MVRRIKHCFSLATLVMLAMLLSSCAHMRHKDGPPNYYVDETKVPNAVPKVEPRSKYGNLATYRVFGKRYYTLKTSKNYDQVGIASWYGTQFHDKSTSSGEPYNMLAMTAAHKTLPLPTYVEVTNLKNHLTVIVKVNDRGPFEANRIIDLSYVAAKKLGMLGHGTATVRVRAIDPLTYGRHIAAAKNMAHKSAQLFQSALQAGKNKIIYLQVGAFKSKQNALKLKHRLTAFLSAPINVYYPSVRGHLYRVQVGPIKDTNTANQITDQLKGLGINSNKTYGA